MEIVLTVIGIVVGIIVTHIYAVRSSKEQANLYGGVIKKYQESHGQLISILEEMRDAVKPSNPQLAERVRKQTDEIQKKEESYRTFIAFDGDRCPKCKEGTLQWSQWGPGPFGFFNAWFKCGKCGAKFPGQEVFGD